MNDFHCQTNFQALPGAEGSSGLFKVYCPQVGYYVCIEIVTFYKGPAAAQEPRQGKERDKYDSSSEPELEPKRHDLDTWRD